MARKGNRATHKVGVLSHNLAQTATGCLPCTFSGLRAGIKFSLCVDSFFSFFCLKTKKTKIQEKVIGQRTRRARLRTFSGLRAALKFGLEFWIWSMLVIGTSGTVETVWDRKLNVNFFWQANRIQKTKLWQIDSYLKKLFRLRGKGLPNRRIVLIGMINDKRKV